MSSEVSRPEGSYFINSVISSHLRALNYPGSIESLEKCGQNNGGYIEISCDCKKSNIIINLNHRCCSRICPYCSNTRKRKLRRLLLPKLMSMKLINPKAHNIMAEGLRFITISPRNYVNHSEGLKDIKNNLNKFTRRIYIKERIKGSIYIIESKVGNDGLWNVHIHAIIQSKYLDNRARGECLDCHQNLLKYDKRNEKYQCANKKCNSNNIVLNSYSKIQEEWKSSAGTDAQIYITEITNHDHLVNYLLKYISSQKEDFKNDIQVAQYLVDTYNKRLLITNGCFYNMKITYIKFDQFCKFCGSKLVYSLILPEMAQLLRDSIQINMQENNPLGRFLKFERSEQGERSSSCEFQKSQLQNKAN